MKTQFSQKPDKIQYMPLPDSGADVWLRKNIKKQTGEMDGLQYTYFEADEVYFFTNDPKAQIEANFEEYFAGNLPKPPIPEVPDSERIAALEAAILDLAEVRRDLSRVFSAKNVCFVRLLDKVHYFSQKEKRCKKIDMSLHFR